SRCTRSCSSTTRSCAAARRSTTSRNGSRSASRPRSAGLARRLVYRNLRFDAAAAEAEAWSDALLAAGALSVELSDPHAGADGETPVYAEPGHDTALWPLSRVTALFPEPADPQAALGNAARVLSLPLPAAEVAPVAEQDWVRATQAQFGPIRIDDGLWIVPS